MYECPFCGAKWVYCEWCGKPLKPEEVRGYETKRRVIVICPDCLKELETKGIIQTSRGG